MERAPRDHLDLFSGIAGFALAARRVGGIRTVAFSEIEPFAERVLQKNFPGIPNFGDIGGWRDWPDLGPLWLVTGGFPCQPYSIAGERLGEADDRALWPEMFAVIARYRPAWCLCENVPGIVSLELDRVLSDLASAGYATRPFNIPALAVGAPHIRDRIWIVAHAAGARCPGGGPELLQGRPAALPGECAGWPAECGVGRVVHGLSGGVDRIRCLGNAIVPQLAEQFLRMMLAAEGEEKAEGKR